MAQEAETAPRQRGSQQTRRWLMQGKTHREETNRRNPCDTSGKAIETVEPINGIGDADKPNNGGSKAENIRQHDHRRHSRDPGEINGPDAHALRPNDHGHSDLARQPRPWRQREKIIGKTDDKEAQRSSQRGPDQLITIRRQQAESTNGPGDG